MTQNGPEHTFVSPHETVTQNMRRLDQSSISLNYIVSALTSLPVTANSHKPSRHTTRILLTLQV